RTAEAPQTMAIAALRYAAEDGAVAGRDLLGDEPQPGREVAAFGEGIAGADRGHRRAGDDRPDFGHAHQPLTTGILARHRFDLARQALNPFIEAPPIVRSPSMMRAIRGDASWQGQARSRGNSMRKERCPCCT